MNYTNKNINYNSISFPSKVVISGDSSKTLTGPIYTTSGSTISSINTKLINAVDIDWNEAQVDTNTTISDTSDLLNWIKTFSNNQSSQEDKIANGFYYYTEFGELINNPEDSIYSIIGIAVIKDDIKFILDIHDYSLNNAKLITTKTGKDIAGIRANSLTDGLSNTLALVLAEGFPTSVDINDWRVTAAMDCQTRTLLLSSSIQNYGFTGYNTRYGSPIIPVHGYLGSIKEMMILSENLTTINSMLTAAEGDNITGGTTYAVSTIMPSNSGYVGTTPYTTKHINMSSGGIFEGSGASYFRTLYPLLAYSVDDGNDIIIKSI